MEKKTEQMDLLMAVEKVVELSKGSHLDEDFFQKAASPLKMIGDTLDLSVEQSVLMSLLIEKSESGYVSISNLADYLQCTTTRIIRYTHTIDELKERKLVRYRHYDDKSVAYRVPADVVEAFKRGEKYTPQSSTCLSCVEFFCSVNDIMEDRIDKGIITEEESISNLLDLCEDNKHLPFVKKMDEYGLNRDEKTILLLFSHKCVNEEKDIHFYDFISFYGKPIIARHRWNPFVENKHILQQLGLVEHCNENGFASIDSFCLSKKAKESLFPELKLTSNSGEKVRNIVKHDSIVPKQLYYDSGVATQVSDLNRLLEETTYHTICERMKEKGYRYGFTCLFYGSPGTGKTEAVLQLARQTGRDILQVNIPEIKSCWVGESEKNIKEVFDQYRMLVAQSDIAPILLFNEADAIIGKRREGADQAVDKMENAIQNIILQEMETLDGILIATTNLAQNMDKAFERRFLYKIQFNKPSLEVRTSIWHTMLPDLADENVRLLAEKYDFSGGQIENVARHYTIDTILHSETSSSMESLFYHCENEQLGNATKRRVGF